MSALHSLILVKQYCTTQRPLGPLLLGDPERGGGTTRRTGWDNHTGAEQRGWSQGGREIAQQGREVFYSPHSNLTGKQECDLQKQRVEEGDLLAVSPGLCSPPGLQTTESV